MVPILQVESLTKYFQLSKSFFGLGEHDLSKQIRAVDNVSFDLEQGKTVGLVGESGCGKSTIARMLIGLIKPTSGQVLLKGESFDLSTRAASAKIRRAIQMIFQDPYGSLNPRMRLKTIISRPLKIHLALGKEELTERIVEVIKLVGLNEDHLTRYPHEFSGGQRQRISIARALAVEPEILVCDEPVSALDVSIQARILNRLQDLQERLNLTYLFISHDLSVVEHISDRIIVMYLGKFMEMADAADLYRSPAHPYTMGLIEGVPKRHGAGKRKVLQGDVETPIGKKKGCAFVRRCPDKLEVCLEQEPPFVEVGKNHLAACHNIQR